MGGGLFTGVFTGTADADADAVAGKGALADADTDGCGSGGGGGVKLADGGVSGAVEIAEVAVVVVPVPVVPSFVDEEPFIATTAMAPTTIIAAATATIIPFALFGWGAGVDCVVSREAPRSVCAPGAMRRVLFGP